MDRPDPFFFNFAWTRHAYGHIGSRNEKAYGHIGSRNEKGIEHFYFSSGESDTYLWNDIGSVSFENLFDGMTLF
jgi:hypothetical protein